MSISELFLSNIDLNIACISPRCKQSTKHDTPLFGGHRTPVAIRRGPNFFSRTRADPLTGFFEGAAETPADRLKSGRPPNRGLVRDADHQRPD